MDIAHILAIIAGVLLILQWNNRGAVWGGATLGTVIGFIVALVTGNWNLLALIFAIGTFTGTVFEWLGRLSQKYKGELD